MPILLAGLQNRVKNCASYAAELGLMLISNGEELPYLLSPNGEIVPAGIGAPTVAPVVISGGTASNALTGGQYIVYSYQYDSENSFPLVAPVLNSAQSPLSAVFQVPLLITFTGIGVAGDIVKIGLQTYTYAASAGAAYTVVVGASTAASVANLISAINASSGAGTTYGSGTVANTVVTASVGAGTTISLTPIIAGIEVDTAATLTNGKFSTYQIDISCTLSTNAFVSHIYLYRTQQLPTAAFALAAAQAGDMNFVAKVANTGSPSFVDSVPSVLGNATIDNTTLTVPQFKFSVWDGNFFWGFGNHPFNAKATWALDGTLVSTEKFWGGRNGQFITFDGVSTGGIDGRGTNIFLQTGDFTGQVVLADGTTTTTLPSAATGNIVIIGQSATLYRSAFRNPFSWGYEQAVGNLFVPALWQLKVAGSLGTAIAIIPDQQLLKLDMEFPALCVTFSLQSASTDIFSQTRRQVSKLYSVTSHFSQFFALSQGRQVLWGMDYKNLAIIQCDGYTQIPISGPISILLRSLTRNRSLQLLCHGLYDPQTEINALWLSSSFVDGANYPTNFDICVYQHAPTGFWGVIQDLGILCSAAIEDTTTSNRSTLVGTENGYVGKAFDITTYGNWLPTNSLYNGFIKSATINSITRSDGQDDFDPIANGIVGNFCLIVDENGLNSQILKISNVTFDTLTFEQNLNIIPTITDDPGLVSGQYQFFIGLIEMRMLKYFDGGEPSVDKAPKEYWATLADANSAMLEFYPEHASKPTDSEQLQQDKDLDAWYTKTAFPTKKEKTFGLALVNREYTPVQMYNFSLT